MNTRMHTAITHLWSRRQWLTSQALGLAAFIPRRARRPSIWRRRLSSTSVEQAARVALPAERLDVVPWQALAQRAVDAARAAGAAYADARLTRVVRHDYGVAGSGRNGGVPPFHEDDEYVGVGVRALVNGYWGFSASAVIEPDEVVRLARDAVAQAKENAKGPPWTVNLGHYPVATGSWATPHRIDPFAVPIEEKQDFILYWKQCAQEAGVDLQRMGSTSWLRFIRQERVVATSEGALFTQTLYESGGQIITATGPRQETTQDVHGLDIAGAGWELFLDAKIPEQCFSGRLAQELAQKAAIPSKPSTIGKYTLVCDGATMAALVESTLGLATQLDRALGYEANAGGTSFLDDPLAMVGHAQVTAPLVTLTANRSAPRELATVKWDDEGVEPEPFTLIKGGVLTDFQTTREQAAWLAPYYQQRNLPVRSHGCAAAESAHVIPLQHMPNLSLEPNASAIRLEDLVADVKDGILVEGGQVMEHDFQARTGLLAGGMREIKNGRVGKALQGGAVLFTTRDLWKQIKVTGGPATQMVIGSSSFMDPLDRALGRGRAGESKGQPPQLTSHSVRAVAATIPNQPLIDPSRKA